MDVNSDLHHTSGIPFQSSSPKSSIYLPLTCYNQNFCFLHYDKSHVTNRVFFRTIPGVSGVVVENIVRSPLEPTAPLTTYRTRFTQINMCHFCLLMTILLYSPTGNRELNFGGGYRRGERVRVPNKRHIHRDAA